jgi:NAD(P)-dependent dehydrogenase (short-subunit alcohol dehydrogenase family)
MKQWQGRVAVITGAASGFGLEAARIAARAGMKIVMADVQAEALELAADDVRGLGAEVLPWRLDVSKAVEVDALATATRERFGAPHSSSTTPASAPAAWSGSTAPPTGTGCWASTCSASPTACAPSRR